MTWGMVAVAGASLVGGAMSANAASSASDKQVGAANNATQAQKDMFNQTVGLEAPFRQAGSGAMDRLSYLLGIGSPTATGGLSPAAAGGGGGGVGGASPLETQDQIRQRLAPQYPGAMPVLSMNLGGAGGSDKFNNLASNPALDAAVQAELQKQQQQQQASPVASAGGLPAGSVPGGDYGSLLKPFGASDFQMDPGVQFQIQQGQQALQNSQAAKDGVLSGGAMKDLMSFNQSMGGLGYQSAFDRYMANKSFTLGSLMDMTNMGQAAAGNTVSAAPGFSNGIAGTITGAGNAAASGMVGSANALSGGISGAGNAYFLRNLLGNNGGGTGGAQAALSQTGVGSSGFGSGLAYGNQDLGQYI